MGVHGRSDGSSDDRRCFQEIDDLIAAKLPKNGSTEPVIAPGEVYEYESACDLRTEIGSMDGYYTVKRKVDNKQYDVEIPRFALIRPTRLN